MAPKHYSSLSFEAYTPSSCEDEVLASDTDDHENSQSDPDTLIGSDTEYECESEPESEVESAKRLRSRSKSKSKTKSKTDSADPKSKKKSSPPPGATDKRPRKGKPDQNGGVCKKKLKKTHPEDGSDLAMETEKIKKKEKSTSLSVGRVWSQSDEIGILIGLVSFHKKYKKFDANKFYSKIIKYIKADVPKARVLEKVVRLKSKYYDHEGNRGPNGEDPVFSKPHEQTLFEISKLVWGINDVEKRTIEDDSGAGAGAGDEKLQEEEEDEDEDEDLYDYDDLVLDAFDNYLVSQEIELRWIGQEKLESLENKWRTLKVAESKFRFKQAWLDARVHRLALITYKSFNI